MPPFIVALLCLMVVDGVVAAPAEVRLLQAPAWREHAGQRSALQPGEALAAGDRIVTGRGARVVLVLSEGSTVKLGENAELSLAELIEPPHESGVFKGFLDVARGAFRFTTSVLGRQREIRARVGTATIGIRGTDVWGKHEDSRDFVVLLEGQIEIERDGVSVVMSEPLSLFMAPAGQAALPLAPVDQEDLGRWAQETEPQAGAGQRDSEGRYRLMLPLAREQVQADALVAHLAAAGYGASLDELTIGDEHAWRVSVPGYSNEVEAQAGASAVAALLAGLRVWVSHAP